MKIALISTPFFGVPPPGYSGLEQVIWDLACALAELGEKVVVFAPGNKNPPKGFLCKTGEPLTDVNVNWLEKEMEMYQAYRDKLGDFDIIHSHNWFSAEYLYKQEHPDAKVCHTHHGHMLWRSKPPGVEKLNLIAISKYMAFEYSKQFSMEVEHVYNGINLERYPFQREKGDRLLFVGRISTAKRPDIAIEVAKRVGMKLDVVGGTFVPNKGYVEGIRRLCEQNDFGFYPDAPHEKKIELMQNAKILLFPSMMNEPFGLCAVEAMACGTPVIATKDGAIPEIVEEGKVGFTCYSIDEMCEAVKRIDGIKPEDCRMHAEKFSREAMGENYLKLYKSILNNGEW